MELSKRLRTAGERRDESGAIRQTDQYQRIKSELQRKYPKHEWR